MKYNVKHNQTRCKNTQSSDLTNYKSSSAITIGPSPNTQYLCLLSTVSYPVHIKAYLCLGLSVYCVQTDSIRPENP